jgi:hypothetical protein
MSSRWEPYTKTDWPTGCRSQLNFNFNFSEVEKCKRLKLGGGQAYDRSSAAWTDRNLVYIVYTKLRFFLEKRVK